MAALIVLQPVLRLLLMRHAFCSLERVTDAAGAAGRRPASLLGCFESNSETLRGWRALRRFIFAFGAAGGFTFLTAATGLAGVSWNSRALLGIYSVLLVLMLVAQARARFPIIL